MALFDHMKIHSVKFIKAYCNFLRNKKGEHIAATRLHVQTNTVDVMR